MLSAVPAVLAQFLRFISSYLEFCDFGRSLCKSLLQTDQVRLFERAFGSSKSKEHLISPCLRLLTEVVTFDGGALASQLYSRKEALFKRLELFLEQTATTDDATNRRMPSLRRIAQRYVIANLRFQSTSVKGDLIGQGKILHALLRGIDKDGDDIVADILQVIQSSILNDKSLSKKSRLLNTTNLQSLLALYDFEEILPADHEEQDHSYFPGKQRQKVRSQIHAFFLAAVQPEKGILLPQNGWYPQGIDPEFAEPISSEAGIIDLGLDSPLHFDEYRDKIPVKNGTLSIFAQNLKPEVDELQASLLLNIFEQAPELVAEYFSKTKRFSSKPKDDPEWRSQSAFLFSVVQLPMLKFCGWHERLPEMPPPTSIVIESILPRPFPQADLTRCMNLAHEIITLFAAKYMTVSLRKLSKTLRMFQSASSNPAMWKEASEKLVETFIERGASVKDIIAAIQRTSKDDKHVRAALIECLAAYFETLLQYAISEKFDVAAIILGTIQKLERDDIDDEDRELLLGQLKHLSLIAEWSTEVRWWYKPDTATLAPFTALLKFTISLKPDTKVRQPILKLLRAVMVDQGAIESEEKAFDALITSLSSTKKWNPDQHTYSFMENCISRVIRQPIKYLEQLENAQVHNSDKNSLSLLACCVAEQWPFIANGDEKDAQKSIASWITRVYDALSVAGGNFRVLAYLQEEILQNSPKHAKSIFEKAVQKQQKKPITLVTSFSEGEPSKEGEAQANVENQQESPLDLKTTFGPQPTPPTSLEGLTKWTASNLETDILSSRLSRLIKCTSSPLEEIRIQTFTTVQSLLTTTLQSTHPDAQRLHLLLGELLETIKLYTLSEPLPALVSSMTTLLLRILTDPSDKMYSKTNRFLLRSPRWDILKLPSYWLTQILLREAEDDDGTNLEIDRLLVMLIDGLACEADMELYRRNGVFERVLSLWSSPHVVEGARRKIYHLVWKAWELGRGPRMTLLTRCGIRAWVDTALFSVRGEEERRILEALRREIMQVLEGEQGTKWKEGRRAAGKNAKFRRNEDAVMQGTN